MKKNIFIHKCIIMMIFIMFIVPIKSASAQWYVVVDDSEIRAVWDMFQQVVPKRSGNFSTQKECEDVLNQSNWLPGQRAKYRCECESNCDGQNSSSYSSGSNTNQQIVDNIIQPLFQNLLDWIFSPTENISSSDGYSQAERDAENERHKKAYEEYQKKVQEQVIKANSEYADLIKKKFENDKQHTVNDFKNRIAKSDAVKNIKVLNCAAYNSIEISKAVLDDQLDFRDLNSSLENNRVLVDFENSKANDCPEVKINVPEVTAINPVSFQERFFEIVKMKSDSITVKVGLMKEKEKQIKELVVQKEKVVEQLKKSENSVDENKKEKEQVNVDNEKLLQEALDALNEAIVEEKKVEDELKKSERDIEQLEQIRSVYDINPKK